VSLWIPLDEFIFVVAFAPSKFYVSKSHSVNLLYIKSLYDKKH
jgi:hypothetical protein